MLCAVIDQWIEDSIAALLQPIIAVTTLFDPHAILIGGRLPGWLLERLSVGLTEALAGVELPARPPSVPPAARRTPRDRRGDAALHGPAVAVRFDPDPGRALRPPPAHPPFSLSEVEGQGNPPAPWVFGEVPALPSTSLRLNGGGENRRVKKGPPPIGKRACQAWGLFLYQPAMSSSSRPRVSLTMARTKKNDTAAKKAYPK